MYVKGERDRKGGEGKRRAMPHVQYWSLVSHSLFSIEPRLQSMDFCDGNKRSTSLSKMSIAISSSIYLNLLTSNAVLWATHLPKRISDPKQKCSRLLTPFYGFVFMPFHGMIHFAYIVTNSKEASDWFLDNFLHLKVVSWANNLYKTDHDI